MYCSDTEKAPGHLQLGYVEVILGYVGVIFGVYWGYIRELLKQPRFAHAHLNRLRFWHLEGRG